MLLSLMSISIFFCSKMDEETEKFIEDVYTEGFMDGWIYVLNTTTNMLLGEKDSISLNKAIKEGWEKVRKKIFQINDSLKVTFDKEKLYLVYSEGFTDGVITGVKDVEEKIPQNINESKLAQEIFHSKKKKIMEILKN